MNVYGSKYAKDDRCSVGWHSDLEYHGREYAISDVNSSASSSAAKPLRQATHVTLKVFNAFMTIAHRTFIHPKHRRTDLFGDNSVTKASYIQY